MCDKYLKSSENCHYSLCCGCDGFSFPRFFTVQAHAVGLLDETIDTAHEFSRYPIDNYQLDFMLIPRGIGCRGTGWMVSEKRRSTQFTCLRTSCGR